MFVSSDRTGPLHGRKPLTWAKTLPLVAANVLCRRPRSLLTNIEMDSSPPDAVQTGEHSRSLLTNEITDKKIYGEVTLDLGSRLSIGTRS